MIVAYSGIVEVGCCLVRKQNNVKQTKAEKRFLLVYKRVVFSNRSATAGFAMDRLRKLRHVPRAGEQISHGPSRSADGEHVRGYLGYVSRSRTRGTLKFL